MANLTEKKRLINKVLKIKHKDLKLEKNEIDKLYQKAVKQSPENSDSPTDKKGTNGSGTPSESSENIEDATRTTSEAEETVEEHTNGKGEQGKTDESEFGEPKTSEEVKQGKKEKQEKVSSDFSEMMDKFEKNDTIGQPEIPIVEKVVPPISISDENRKERKETKKIGRPLGSTKKKAKEFDTVIEGYVLLSFIDFLIPISFSLLHNLLTKTGAKEIEVHEIQLNEDQYKKMEPLADRCAEYIQINISPIWIFAITMLMTYGANFYAVKKLSK